jgi:hypothetical protein
MPIDAYAACPGGLDKKVKFCCQDLVTELEKLGRMIEGDQRAAALDYLEKLESKSGDRACLLALKSALLAASEREEDLHATVERFRKAFPQNPIALAESALYTSQTKGLEAGIAELQDALERVENNIPRQVYDAIGGIGVAALQAGRPIAALAHLTLQSMLDPADESPLALIARIMSSPSVPLSMKDVRGLPEAPAGAPWKSTYDEALHQALRGRWRRAAAWLLVIAAKHGNPAEIWETIGTLRAWLADHAGAVEALRRVAAMEVPFDKAVEAEMLAQLLDPHESQQTIDVLNYQFPVADADRLGELLLASDQVVSLPVDRRQYADEEVPPRGVYVLLDRPQPRGAAELTIAQVPRVVGTLSLFGKQTDREARLELLTYRTDELQPALEAVHALAGDTIRESPPPEVADKMHPVRHAMASNWYLPADLPAERARALNHQLREEMLFERWPALPLPALGNQSALDVKDNPAFRIRLAALVELLELSAQQESADLDFSRLRTILGLPLPRPLDPAQVDLARLPLVRYPRLDIPQLTDEQLLGVFRTVASVGLRDMLRGLAEEILRRPSLATKVDLAGVHRALIAVARDPDEALRRVEAGRAWATSANKSSAPWDLEELSLRLMRDEASEASRLIEHLMREHANEPGVRQSLAELLYAAGVIGPDGRPAGPLAGQAGPAPAAVAPEPSGIWTPESAAGGETKSKLWVPGMD